MGDRDGYELIIVGAGSTGCTLAARLSEDPSRRVALVEAGPDFGAGEGFPPEVRGAQAIGAWMPGYVNSWNFVGRISEASPEYPMARGRLVGGSSAINGTVFARGNRGDFDNWAAGGNDLWSWDRVLPFYIGAERDLNFDGDLHGTGGPMIVDRPLFDEARDISEAFAEACVSAGFAEKADKNAPGPGGVGPIPRNVDGETRLNVAMAYLTPEVRARPNLTVIAGTYVRRVLIEGGRAVGIEAEGVEGPLTLSAEEVVLSAGALKSPQLLMLSGIGPEASLRAAGVEVLHDRPGLGTAVKDHPTVFAAVHIDDGPELPEGIVMCHNGLDFTAPGSEQESDCEITWGKMADTLNLNAVLGLERSCGTISLASADPAEPPRIDLNYLSDPADLPTLVAAVRVALGILSSAELGAMNVDPFDLPAAGAADDELGAWVTANVASSLHTHNSTPMGPASDPLAVVDQHCRVHGVEGLRVADVGIVPAIRTGPAATAVMIGERLAALMSTTGGTDE